MSEPDGPTRRCIVSRAVKPKEAMLRFVVSPDGVVTPDVDARLPGRGFWLSPAPNVVEKARKKGVFSRAARQLVVVPKDLSEQVDSVLENRCLRLIGLARKAGQAVVGYEKVKALLQTDKAAYVLEAFDAADNARRKLNARAFGIPVYTVLDRTALSNAFGRDNAVHSAVLPGGLARRLRTDLIRLGRLRARLDKENELEQVPKRNKGPRAPVSRVRQEGSD